MRDLPWHARVPWRPWLAVIHRLTEQRIGHDRVSPRSNLGGRSTRAGAPPTRCDGPQMCAGVRRCPSALSRSWTLGVLEFRSALDQLHGARRAASLA